jgi:hypothetical protein
MALLTLSPSRAQANAMKDLARRALELEEKRGDGDSLRRGIAEAEFADFATDNILALAARVLEVDGPSGLSEQLEAARKAVQIELRLRQQAEARVLALEEENERLRTLLQDAQRLIELNGGSRSLAIDAALAEEQA